MKAHMTMRTLAAAGLALCLSSGTALAAERTTDIKRGQLTAKDYKFLVDAARGGRLEVQLGEIAQQKGVNQAVRSFGQRMATDHLKANDELSRIAARKGATMPVQLSRGEDSTMDHLQKLSGGEFDRAYASHMVKDHKTDLREFERAAKALNDPDLREFAQKTLATLQQHLGMAQEMEVAVKGEK
jgi:putative membrane protein